MAAIKPIDSITEKFTRRASTSGQDYADGVANPRRSWSQAAAAAESAYEGGVTKAIARKAFGKGVKSAGDGKWAEGATQKGVQRWPAGVQQGAGRYQQGFAPYHQAISSVTLPPRYAKRDPRNLDRVRAIVDVTSKVKEQQSR